MANEPDTSVSGKFKVTNVTNAIRIIYGPGRKAVVIQPGETIVTYVTESDEAHIRKSKSLRLVPADDGDEPTVQRRQDDKTPQYVARTPEELLLFIKANKDSYMKWMPTAKHILGDDWPSGAGGGMPKQAAITKALRDRIKAEKAAEK